MFEICQVYASVSVAVPATAIAVPVENPWVSGVATTGVSALTAAIPRINTKVITSMLRDPFNGYLPLLPSLSAHRFRLFSIYHFRKKTVLFSLYTN